jgi:hypothetical protein
MKFDDFSAKNLKKSVYYNENMSPNSNFKCNYLENYNGSEVVVKMKNAPFFMSFRIIYFYIEFFPGGVVL